MGLFSSPSFDHPQLGRLIRKSGRWRGTLAIPGLPPASLSVPGDRSSPEADALVIAVELPSRWPALRSSLAAHLFAHYSPYAEAVASGEQPEGEDPVPLISAADDVWAHVRELAVAVRARKGGTSMLLGFDTAWDLEHTLGATIEDWTVTEFSGSIGRFEL